MFVTLSIFFVVFPQIDPSKVRQRGVHPDLIPSGNWLEDKAARSPPGGNPDRNLSPTVSEPDDNDEEEEEEDEDEEDARMKSSHRHPTRGTRVSRGRGCCGSERGQIGGRPPKRSAAIAALVSISDAASERGRGRDARDDDDDDDDDDEDDDEDDADMSTANSKPADVGDHGH